MKNILSIKSTMAAIVLWAFAGWQFDKLPPNIEITSFDPWMIGGCTILGVVLLFSNDEQILRLINAIISGISRLINAIISVIPYFGKKN